MCCLHSVGEDQQVWFTLVVVVHSSKESERWMFIHGRLLPFMLQSADTNKPIRLWLVSQVLHYLFPLEFREQICFQKS